MPLPATRTVTGTYTNPVTGAAAAGTVTLTPIPRVWTDTDGTQILAGGGEITLVAGAFSQALVTTDADDVEPETGRYWRITEELTGLPVRTRVFALPLGAGTPIDITAIVAADPGATQYTPVEGPQPDLGAAGAGDDIALRSTDPTTTNARTPTAHAASHADGGSDELTLTMVQISDLAAALALLAQLSGATFTGAVTVSGADLSVLDPTKGYRFRRGGGALDLEATGSDLLISNWSGTSFDGTQRSYFRLSADAQNTQVAGKVEFVDGLYGATRHVLDGAANQAGFFGASPTGQPTVTGSRGGNAALASLLTALDTLGLIDDQTTA